MPEIGKILSPERLVVLLADGNNYMRRITRSILINLKVRTIHEAGDGVSALDAIRHAAPDVMILDWNLPVLDGAELLRMIRTPGTFPLPDLPVIVLVDDGRITRIEQAMEVGAHEVLVKPISPKLLQTRLLGLLKHPRPMVRSGERYVPGPRNPENRASA